MSVTNNQAGFQKTYVVVRPVSDKPPVSTPENPPLPAPPVEPAVQGVEDVVTTAEPLDTVAAVHKEAPDQVENTRQQETDKPVLETEAARARKVVSKDAESSVKKPLYTGTAREVGKQLLGMDGKQPGAIPLITMDYRRTLGWPGYVREMLRLGGLFFIYDNGTERICARADVVNGKLLPTSTDSLKGLSPRMREIKSEIAAADLMQEVNKTLGKGDYSLILLLPLNVDADIIGGIAKSLADRDIDIQTVGRIIGEHELKTAALSLRLQQLVLRDGTAQHINIIIKL